MLHPTGNSRTAAIACESSTILLMVLFHITGG